jgi:hypothetical protein
LITGCVATLLRRGRAIRVADALDAGVTGGVAGRIGARAIRVADALDAGVIGGVAGRIGARAIAVAEALHAGAVVQALRSTARARIRVCASPA